MISDKTFQLAKNIGFDLKTCNCGGFPECICYEVKPTQAVLQKWLREQKNTDVLISHQFSSQNNHQVIYDVCVTTSINNVDDEKYCNYGYGELFSKYEDALEYGLIKAVKILSTQSCSKAKIAVNVRVLGEEADKQDHIPDVSKKVHK